MTKKQEGKPCPDCAKRAELKSASINRERRRRAEKALKMDLKPGERVRLNEFQHGEIFRVKTVTPAHNVLAVFEDEWDKSTNAPVKKHRALRRDPRNVTRV